jgi:molybdopterin-containing oxidoreductase family membrane subunit
VTGLLPDFAMLRDRAITPLTKSLFYLEFGWSGRAKDWQRFEEVSLLVLAGLATFSTFCIHILFIDGFYLSPNS